MGKRRYFRDCEDIKDLDPIGHRMINLTRARTRARPQSTRSRTRVDTHRHTPHRTRHTRTRTVVRCSLRQSPPGASVGVFIFSSHIRYFLSHQDARGRARGRGARDTRPLRERPAPTNTCPTRVRVRVRARARAPSPLVAAPHLRVHTPPSCPTHDCVRPAAAQHTVPDVSAALEPPNPLPFPDSPQLPTQSTRPS